MMDIKPIQLRYESGKLEEVDTIQEALDIAKKDDKLWKISFDLREERIRLTRNGNGFFELHQMYDELKELVEELGIENSEKPRSKEHTKWRTCKCGGSWLPSLSCKNPETCPNCGDVNI